MGEVCFLKTSAIVNTLQLLFCLFPPPSTFLTPQGSDVLWSQQTLAQSHAFCCKLIGSSWIVGCMRPNYLKGDVCCSVTKSCQTLCDPMDCSTPGLPVHHQLPEFTQTHVHRVGDAIQPSHPLSPPSPPAPNPSQHQSLFQ